ncbi:MAG: hypothetical protein KJO53_16340 [Eudoraea sp.]|nr:hypothetical protein [Eudoraea sp.]
MKIVLLITLSFFLNAQILLSQRNSPGTASVARSPLENDAVLKWLNDANNSQSSKGNQNLDVSSIEGSPYYNAKFIPGNIYYLEKIYGNYPMRYNAFSDEVEIQRAGSNKMESVYKSMSLSCDIDSEKFVYSKYINQKGEVQEGYLIRLNASQKYILYQRKSKIYKEGKKAATSMHPSYPPKFEDKYEYFLSADNEYPVYFKPSKKELAELFGQEKSSDIKDFIKQNKIKLTQKEDLMKLVEYLNSDV